MGLFDSTKSYGRWTVIEFSHSQRQGDHFDRYWACRCECGTQRPVNEKNLKDGLTNSCGCARKKNLLKHRYYRCWTSWARMIQRCHNPKHKHYSVYGGRWIFVCERWRECFENFFEDMGDRPEGCTLDRKNNDIGYEKDNCKWSGSKEQQRNKRNNRLITYKDQTRPLTEWAELLNIVPTSLAGRLERGWTIEATFETPVKIYKKRS